MTAHQAPGAQIGIGGDPVAALDAEARATLAAIADHLIPAAHGMPSAADIVDDERLNFVLDTRPDLVEPLVAALRGEPGEDLDGHLARLERDTAANHAALTFVIVAGYYTAAEVRQRIGYPGQQRIMPHPDAREPWLVEGLTDAVLAHGPVYKDPATGRRAAPPAAERAARKEPS